MKITIKFISDPDETVVDTQSTTLGALLDELSNDEKVATDQFFDRERREIYSDCEVVVNGRILTDGLNTELKDGDRVEIYVNMADGG